jgi:hypothetical protein
MRVLTLVVTALLVLATDPGWAQGKCCENRDCCAKASCCKHQQPDDAVVHPMMSGLTVVTPGFEWPVESARPVREYARVLFRDPVKIGDRILMGAYVIEHDTERMAQGRPCTHIYQADDRRVPVAAFHCVHVERKAAPQASVTLRPIAGVSVRMFELVEFQFQNSADGHGVPDAR